MIFINYLKLPNGKIINHNDLLYYGINKNQVATNNQISSLQSQINNINLNVNNYLNNGVKLTLLSGSVDITNFLSQTSGYHTQNIFTLPNNTYYCVCSINALLNFTYTSPFEGFIWMNNSANNSTIYLPNSLCSAQIEYSPVEQRTMSVNRLNSVCILNNVIFNASGTNAWGSYNEDSIEKPFYFSIARTQAQISSINFTSTNAIIYKAICFHT